jgi:hypothetical protein
LFITHSVAWLLSYPLSGRSNPPLFTHLRRISLPRLYEKASSASQSPQHEATHGSVHERLAGCTQLLLVPKLIVLL